MDTPVSKRIWWLLERGFEWLFEPVPYWKFWRLGSGPLGGVAMGIVFLLIMILLRHLY